MVVLDVWGGERSTEWLARFMLPLDEALQRARIELSLGYLVNLRQDAAFGAEQSFDYRTAGNA